MLFALVLFFIALWPLESWLLGGIIMSLLAEGLGHHG